jgi:hypothetical protein
MSQIFVCFVLFDLSCFALFVCLFFLFKLFLVNHKCLTFWTFSLNTLILSLHSIHILFSLGIVSSGHQSPWRFSFSRKYHIGLDDLHDHAESCGKVEIQCSSCTEIIFREDQILHMDDCLMADVTCQNIGCGLTMFCLVCFVLFCFVCLLVFFYLSYFL